MLKSMNARVLLCFRGLAAATASPAEATEQILSTSRPPCWVGVELE